MIDGQRKTFQFPGQVVSQAPEEFFMPVKMGDPRDAHVTGTASSPIGTWLVKLIKCT